jgi:hypothetical protein
MKLTIRNFNLPLKHTLLVVELQQGRPWPIYKIKLGAPEDMAIAQLLDCVDMDGALRLREDIASGVMIDYGIVSFSAENGTRATLPA